MLSLKQLRKDRGYSQLEIANYLGITKQAYSNYELGKRSPSIQTISRLAKFYQVPIETFLSTNEIPTNSVKIPVLGSVPAGIAIEAIEDIVDWEEIPKSMVTGEKQYFGLVVDGDSMYPKYLSGDTVIVLRQPYCNSGEDCIVYVNGYNATLKTLIKHSDGSITLKPINPEYPPHTYSADDVKSGLINVAGVVVELRRKIK